jgi:hypothetical protein
MGRLAKAELVGSFSGIFDAGDGIAMRQYMAKCTSAQINIVSLRAKLMLFPFLKVGPVSTKAVVHSQKAGRSSLLMHWVHYNDCTALFREVQRYALRPIT